MFSSDSPFRALSLIIPFDEFSVLCSDTSTVRLKEVYILAVVQFESFELFLPVTFDFSSFSPI